MATSSWSSFGGGILSSAIPGTSTMSKAGRSFFRVKRAARPKFSFGGGDPRRTSTVNNIECPRHFNANTINNNYSNNNGVYDQARRNSAENQSMFQLVTTGLVSVIGTGVLVIAGHVANDVTGPAIISSLIIAAITSLLSGLCYAEFVTRQSELSDSVYSSFYENIGELPAFVVGWSQVLQHVSGLAATGSVVSALVDYFCGHRMRQFMWERISGIWFFPTRPDIVAFIVVVLASLMYGVGLRWARRLGLFLVGVTVCVALLFVLIGAKHVESRRWTTSGFLPDESSGLLSGAAICTYAFCAHYAIGSKVKPVKRPERNVPLAIGITLTSCFIVYFAVVTVLTLMVHRSKLELDVPLVEAFEVHDVGWARCLMAILKSIGLVLVLLQLSCELHLSVVTLVTDGMLFKWLSEECRPRNVASVLPTLIFGGGVASLMSMLTPLTSLLEIMALSPLIINVLVCCCVLHRRYQPENDWFYEPLTTFDVSSASSSIPSSSSLPSSPVATMEAYREKSMSPPPPLPEQAKQPASRFYINRQAIFPLVKQNSQTTSDNGDAMVEDKATTSDLPLLALPCASPLDSDADLIDDSDFISSDNNSDTDIDAIVAEYKEKIRVATLTTASLASRSCSFNVGDDQFPTAASGRRVFISVIVLSIAFFFVSLIMVIEGDALGRGNVTVVATLCLLSTVVVAFLVVIVRQPQNHSSFPSGQGFSAGVFQVPFSPWIPTIATFLNVCLLATILQKQWTAFSLWMITGSGFYFMYGVWNSVAACQSHRKHRNENIKLQPLPKQPFMSSVLPIHSQNVESNTRVTQVDTILISR